MDHYVRRLRRVMVFWDEDVAAERPEVRTGPRTTFVIFRLVVEVSEEPASFGEVTSIDAIGYRKENPRRRELTWPVSIKHIPDVLIPIIEQMVKW